MTVLEKRRVLIADDERSMRTTLADILVDNGFEVSTAEDGLAAVEMCQRENYDVVLMDVRMPGIDGIEAYRRIRKTLANVRVILMSAYGEEDLKHEVLQEGAIAFLDKPLNLEKLIQLLADALEISILAVTDDDELVAHLPSCLKPASENLTVVRSTVEALELMQQLYFDVVLIDTELPRGNGLDCYLALRDVSRTVTAIMVSSSDEDLLDLAEKAVRRTAYTVIQKPLNRETLLDTILQLRAQRISGSVRKPNGSS